MRRQLDPLQLEALAHDSEEQPTMTPMEWLQAALKQFLVLFVLAVVVLTALALALGDVQGVKP
ncbi:hypothetical protein [Variovorax sp. V15]|uniref:hypothetical protein n=1 Tax=Variovorax sp. V15 TaxID=3065952 RepID=UPI0034E8F438